jgi:hypothetical protein
MSKVTHTTYSETQTLSHTALNTIHGSLETATAAISNANIKKGSLDSDNIKFSECPVNYWATVQSESNANALAVASVQTTTDTTATIVQSDHGSKHCKVAPDIAVYRGDIVRLTFHWEVQSIAFTSGVTDRLVKFFFRTVWTTAGTVDSDAGFLTNTGIPAYGSMKRDGANNKSALPHRSASWDIIFTVGSTDTLEEVLLYVQSDNGSGSNFNTTLGEGSMTVQIYNR